MRRCRFTWIWLPPLQQCSHSPPSTWRCPPSCPATGIRFRQRYKEITHDPLPFSVARRINVLIETLTQYITFNRGGRGESVLLYSLGRFKVAQQLLYNSDSSLSAGNNVVDWKQFSEHPLYTVTLHNFLVMAMTVKITLVLATVTSCIDPSVRIVEESPEVGPLLISPISLGTGNSSEGQQNSVPHVMDGSRRGTRAVPSRILCTIWNGLMNMSVWSHDSL